MPENLWSAELEALVRGVAHALSNRVGTLVAATGMLTPGATAPAPVVDVLRAEGERLEELLALVRLLGGDDGAPEPIHLPDIVTPVVALHSHHPVWRDIPVQVTPDPLAPPVRARHAGLVRALLVLLSAAKRGAGVEVAWQGVPEGVALTVGGVSGTEAPAAVAEAARLLGDGAIVEGNAAGFLVRLPRL